MPGYQKLLDEYGSRGFAVVGFKFDTMMDTEDPIRFAERVGVRYPLAVASDEVKEKFGGIQGLPTTMIYDRGGTLRQKIIGFEYTSVVESVLRSLLSRQLPSIQGPTMPLMLPPDGWRAASKGRNLALHRSSIARAFSKGALYA
jgi:hypothetical protein